MSGIPYGIVHRAFVITTHIARIFRYVCICRPINDVNVCDRTGKISCSENVW